LFEAGELIEKIGYAGGLAREKKRESIIYVLTTGSLFSTGEVEESTYMEKLLSIESPISVEFNSCSVYPVEP